MKKWEKHRFVFKGPFFIKREGRSSYAEHRSTCMNKTSIYKKLTEATTVPKSDSLKCVLNE
jgi:hypothetical protein